MNNEQLKSIYKNAMVSDSGASARIADAEFLAKHNATQYDAQSNQGKGGGVFIEGGMFDGYQKPVVVADAKEAVGVVGSMMDSLFEVPAFNPASSGVPQPLTTIWTTRMIEQVYKKTTLSEVAGSWQQGVPGVTDIKIPVIGFEGVSEPYSDFSMSGNSSVNVTWVPRQLIQLEQTLAWGDMQQAQFALAKIEYVTRLREAQSITIAQQQNDIGFQGYTATGAGNSPYIYGIINEPNLNPAISLPADGVVPGTITPTVAWYGKDFNQLCRDFRLLFQALSQTSEGWVSLSTKVKLLLPPSAQTALTTPNPLSSVTFGQFLKETYNVEIVVCPNFEASLVTTGETTGETLVMLQAQHPNGEMPYDELFVTKWLGHRPVPMASSVAEKVSYILGGCILKYPFLVTTAYGV
jgi:hypothetical protein